MLQWFSMPQNKPSNKSRFTKTWTSWQRERCLCGLRASHLQRNSTRLRRLYRHQKRNILDCSPCHAEDTLWEHPQHLFDDRVVRTKALKAVQLDVPKIGPAQPQRIVNAQLLQLRWQFQLYGRVKFDSLRREICE